MNILFKKKSLEDIVFEKYLKFKDLFFKYHNARDIRRISVTNNSFLVTTDHMELVISGEGLYLEIGSKLFRDEWNMVQDTYSRPVISTQKYYGIFGLLEMGDREKQDFLYALLAFCECNVDITVQEKS